MAEDIQDFLKARQIEKVVIIGHSMGGRAMMTFAFKYVSLRSLYLNILIYEILFWNKAANDWKVDHSRYFSSSIKSANAIDDHYFRVYAWSERAQRPRHEDG